MEKIAAVTGATGFVGRNIVRELLEHGWSVRALVRSEDKARKVLPESERLSFVVGGVLDDAVLDRLMDGATASVHLIGIIRESGGDQTFEKMHHEATRRVVAAAERASGDTPMRHLQMSALGVRDGSTIPYQATKRAGEKAVEASGLRWTIFRPGLIHGPEGEFTNMAADWVRGKAAPFLFIPYFVPGWLPGGRGAAVAPVRVEDVAAMFRTALEREASIGRTYDLAGPEILAFDEMLRVYREKVPGAKRLPLIGVPGKIAALKAKLFGMIGLGGLLPFDEGMARMAMEESMSECARARADLGFEPQSFTESLASYADRL
ncbi:MAG: SDR family NAD(P)-dependent oxidoreductase [Phycisphaerales bacterium]|nr:SDR family NAD(P)-dependent oxidoreductase [Planctomycetota bacterium]MCH8509650.1 SDR family NAD(P)-dependent oxidoreductase [Phycisphaerales bacterium]